MKTINSRETQYDILDIFLERQSFRAMSGEAISSETMMTLFDAAHWAPSSFNEQPWRFIYVTREHTDFELFLSFLVESNQVWCKNAGALVVALSKMTLSLNGKPNMKHSLDTGSAWMSMALQGASMGLVVHAMGGYQDELLRKELSLSEDFQVECMIAVGKHGKVEDLPEPIQKGETPSQRKNLNEVVFEGKNGSQNL